MKYLIKYATRSRPMMFLDAIKNIKSTIGDVDYQILVTVDYTDGSMDDEVLKEAQRYCPYIIWHRDHHTSKVHAINNGMHLVSDWDILVNTSDDMLFCEPKWGEKMLKLITGEWTDTDFFAHFNDGYVQHRLPTMSIMGRKYYERDNYIYDPSYKSFSCDAEAMFVAMMRGKYKYFPDILFRHQHPSNNRTVPTDQLYRNNGQHEPHDTANYFERRRHGFFVENPACYPFNPDDFGEGDVLEPPYQHIESAAIKVRWGSYCPSKQG